MLKRTSSRHPWRRCRSRRCRLRRARHSRCGRASASTGQLVDLGGVGLPDPGQRTGPQYPDRRDGADRLCGLGMSQADWDRVSGGPGRSAANGQTINGSALRRRRHVSPSDHVEDRQRRARLNVERDQPYRAGAADSRRGRRARRPARVRRRASHRCRRAAQWTPTGITVRRGEMLTISADGEIRISGRFQRPRDRDGIVNQRVRPARPAAPHARRRADRPHRQRRAVRDRHQRLDAGAGRGQLFLGINDSNVADNDGSFQVHVNARRSVKASRGSSTSAPAGPVPGAGSFVVRLDVPHVQ